MPIISEEIKTVLQLGFANGSLTQLIFKLDSYTYFDEKPRYSFNLHEMLNIVTTPWAILTLFSIRMSIFKYYKNVYQLLNVM